MFVLQYSCEGWNDASLRLPPSFFLEIENQRNSEIQHMLGKVKFIRFPKLFVFFIALLERLACFMNNGFYFEIFYSKV